MLALSKYSLGVGDRFAHQAKAQLRACLMAAERGAEVVPVWNKSHREHTTIGSEPGSVRTAADAAVRELGWNQPYHVDADHIRLETVDGFLASSDFYTIDVADAIGRPAAADAVKAFADRHPDLVGRLQIPGIEAPFQTTRADVERIAGKYLLAVQEAGRIYRHIASAKGEGRFITEVSMDETDSPQTPPELLVILAAIADEKIPIQTIAPKFTGRFNKGVDYVGNLAQFEKEFHEDLAVIAFAVRQFGLPANLKLSVHSGSDKFSIYAPIRRRHRPFRRRPAPQDGRHHLAGRGDRPGRGRRRGTRSRQGDLRQGPGQKGCAVRPIRGGDRHRRRQVAVEGDGEGLVVGAVRVGAAARPRLQGVQPVAAAADPRRLQDRRPDGRPLPADARSV